jgi:hypothetical protein
MQYMHFEIVSQQQQQQQQQSNNSIIILEGISSWEYYLLGMQQ